MSTIRSFVAVKIPPEVKAAIASLEQTIKTACPDTSAKWIQPESIHLTLKFLGNIESKQVPEITTTLAETAANANSFKLSITGLGVFPGWRSPRILWMGLDGAIGKLSFLQQATEKNLERLGFKPESRPFSPHLTIARIRDSATPKQIECLGTTCRKLATQAGNSFHVNEIHLIRSELLPGGAKYTTLATIPLKL